MDETSWKQEVNHILKEIEMKMEVTLSNGNEGRLIRVVDSKFSLFTFSNGKDWQLDFAIILASNKGCFEEVINAIKDYESEGFKLIKVE